MRLHRLSDRSPRWAATVFFPIRVSRASSPCRAPGLGLEQGLVPLTEPGRTLHFRKRVAESVLMVPSRPGLPPALVVLASWTELAELPQQDLPHQRPGLPSA